MAGEGLECVLAAHVQHPGGVQKYGFVELLKSFSSTLIYMSCMQEHVKLPGLKCSIKIEKLRVIAKSQSHSVLNSKSHEFYRHNLQAVPMAAPTNHLRKCT